MRLHRIPLASALTLALAVTAHAQQAKATYVDAARVAGGGTFATAPEYAVQLLKRTAPGQAEVHVKETDIFYVVDGEATFVTGGKVVGGKETQPNQIRGESIDGGETYHLKKGDSITVPAGVPHWFKEIAQPVSYFTVKSIKP
jgi:mannose-6-phosphate isomerase-like protein (cupin superfamily)